MSVYIFESVNLDGGDTAKVGSPLLFLDKKNHYGKLCRTYSIR